MLSRDGGGGGLEAQHIDRNLIMPAMRKRQMSYRNAHLIFQQKKTTEKQIFLHKEGNVTIFMTIQSTYCPQMLITLMQKNINILFINI